MKLESKWALSLILVGVGGSIACGASDTTGDESSAVRPEAKSVAADSAVRKDSAQDAPQTQCGYVGEGCCSTDPPCAEGLHCAGGFCSSAPGANCGQPGQVCCDPNVGGGIMCLYGSCGPDFHCDAAP